MKQSEILSLHRIIPPGQLVHNPEWDRIEAYIPTSYPTNHASYLTELQNGDLLCVWFAGSDEGAADIRIVMSRLKKNSNTWTKPEEISNESGKAEQNPSLFQTPKGELWLIHTAMETRGCTLQEWQQKVQSGKQSGAFAMQHTSVIRRRISYDGGITWEQGETLFDTPGSFCRQPIQILSNGRWIIGNWRSIDEHLAFGSDSSVFQLSDDQGASWKTVHVPASRGRVHGNVVELASGRLLAFFRSRSADYIYISRSDDYGLTWSEPKRSTLPNNNASISAIRLHSGRIAIAYNDCRGGNDPHATIWPYERYPLTIAISEDEGRTWPYRRHITTGDGYCGKNNFQYNRRYEYPSLIQTADGLLHVSYSHGTRQCIRHICFPEAWVLGDGESRWPWRNFPVT